jgi:hypothetical protein
LPPNHPLCISQSEAEIAIEFYEDLWVRKRSLDHQLEDASGSDYYQLKRQLRGVHSALGLPVEIDYDPLIDKWERELEAGITPDLNEVYHGR